MISVYVNDQHIAFSGEMFAQAVIGSVPGFIVGTEPPKSMQQQAIKSGVKGLVPMLLGMIHKEIVDKHLPIAPPDLKCPAAKANIVVYGICYILANATAIAEQTPIRFEGEPTEDGTFVITGQATAVSEDGTALAERERPTLLASGTEV